jgi:hypothetical protein
MKLFLSMIYLATSIQAFSAASCKIFPKLQDKVVSDQICSAILLEVGIYDQLTINMRMIEKNKAIVLVSNQTGETFRGQVSWDQYGADFVEAD